MVAVPTEAEQQERPLGNRFVVRGCQIVKLSNGEVIPIEEPLFLLRARDWLALPLLLHFRTLLVSDGCNEYILELLDAMIEKFKAFAASYPERMKQPGVTRGK